MNGYSLHIGLNYIDPNHYSGWDGKLTACEYDAYDMQDIAKSIGYSTKILIREQATRNSVTEEIINYSKKLKPGDILFISYSGHGGFLPDLNNDEEDAKDETWCLYDGQLIDDELYFLWSNFSEGVRIIVTSDSCHSETMLKSLTSPRPLNQIYSRKNMNLEIMSRTYYKNLSFYKEKLERIKDVKSLEIKSSIKLISGCEDDQYSYDGPFNGVFTAHLKKVWNGGKFKSNYSTFCKKIRKSINNSEQTPRLTTIGKRNLAFDNQSPFQIK